MAGPLDPIKAAVTAGMGKTAVQAHHDGSAWTVTVDGYVDGVKFTTAQEGTNLPEAAEKVMALIKQMKGAG